MSAADYSELQGMPEGCTTSDPWGYSPIAVVVPYGPVSDFAAEMKPLIDSGWGAHPFMSSEEAYAIDSPPGAQWSEGGLGYQSSAEIAALNKLSPVASATANNTAFYHPEAKAAIVSLASEAFDLFSEIRAAYKEYEPGGAITYPLKPSGARPVSWEAIPLSVPDTQVNQMVDQSMVGLGVVQRGETRQNIRDAYHKAIHLLWCALYGSNQSKSWRENKRIYGQKYGGTGGGELAPGPVAPPPVPPGEFPPWIVPETEPIGPGPSGPPTEPLPGVEARPTGPLPPLPPLFPPPLPPPPPRPEGEPGMVLEPTQPGPGPDAGPEGVPEGEPLPDGYPPPPPAPAKKKGGGAGVAIAIVVTGAFLLARKK